jgi:hypothetical protein
MRAIMSSFLFSLDILTQNMVFVDAMGYIFGTAINPQWIESFRESIGRLKTLV